MATPSLSPLASLEARARELVAPVRDDPEGRFRLRAEFYRKHGGGEPGDFGYGNSEMAFLRWEIVRGVLNPLDHPQRAGSPWWRSVNEEFIFLSEFAGLIHESGLELSDVRPSVRCWLDYLQKPAPKAWYRAHNASIVEAYVQQAGLALKENPYERAFINVVLYRLLYAESLEEGAGIGLGRWSTLLAMPALPAVRVVVQLPRLYPTAYPLLAAHGKNLRKLVSRRVVEASTREFGGALPVLELPEPVSALARGLLQIKALRNAIVFLLYYLIASTVKDVVFLGRLLENFVQFVLDRVLIMPHLSELYTLAAKDWLQTPELTHLLVKGVPAYAHCNRAGVADKRPAMPPVDTAVKG